MKSAAQRSSGTALRAHKKSRPKKPAGAKRRSATTVLKLLRYPVKDQKRVDQLLRELD